MKKDYNRDVVSDMPIEASFTSSVSKSTQNKTTKPKINAIGSQKKTSSSASKTSKTSNGTSKTSKTSSTSASKTSKTTKTSAQDENVASKKLRTKLTNSENDITDLEKLNEENLKTFRFKNKREKVIIAVLSVLLIVAIVTIVSISLITRLKENCNFRIYGDVNAEFVINGEEMDEFRSPSNLQGNRIFEFDVDVKIKSGGYYYIKFIPLCYQKGVLMKNTLVYEQNINLFYEGGDGYYYSLSPIEGGQTIRLCSGVILDYDYEETLNVDNFKMDFCVYFEKV